MRVVIEPLDDVESFLDDWRRVYALSDAHFFLSPCWIETLIAVSGDPARFNCLKLYDDLRGVYALALISRPDRRPFPALRAARLNESGVESLDGVYIEYNDLLIACDAPEDARAAAVTAILDAHRDADQLVFRNIRRPMAAAVTSACAAAGVEVEVLNRQPTFGIDLASRGPSLIESFPASLRYKVKRSIRRYRERGAVLLERPSGDADRAVAWTEMMRLHAETWARRGQRGAFQERRFRTFHEHMIERFPRHVDLARLTAGEETIGILYNFVMGGRAYNYQSGFKYESDNQLTPGFVAHTLAAQQYLDEGYSTYDFMAGDAEYKRRLGEEGELLLTMAITRRNLRSRLRAAAKPLFDLRHAGTHRT